MSFYQLKPKIVKAAKYKLGMEDGFSFRIQNSEVYAYPKIYPSATRVVEAELVSKKQIVPVFKDKNGDVLIIKPDNYVFFDEDNNIIHTESKIKFENNYEMLISCPTCDSLKVCKISSAISSEPGTVDLYHCKRCTQDFFFNLNTNEAVFA